MTADAAEHLRGYPVKRRRIEVAGWEYEVLGPADCESLVDDPRVAQRFEQDEYMPYWAEFWPAAVLLAEAVAAWGSAGQFAKPLSILELGCGLGLVSLVGSRLGHSVTASDYDDDALAFVLESARRNGLPAPHARYIDWRQTYPDLRFDRIVAADVLYETRNLRPIAEFVRTHLDADGLALICDANRCTADVFDGIARHCGLSVETEAVERRVGEGDTPVRGRLFHLRHRTPS